MLGCNIIFHKGCLDLVLKSWQKTSTSLQQQFAIPRLQPLPLSDSHSPGPLYTHQPPPLSGIPHSTAKYQTTEESQLLPVACEIIQISQSTGFSRKQSSPHRLPALYKLLHLTAAVCCYPMGAPFVLP